MATTYENPTGDGDRNNNPAATDHLQALQDDAKAALDQAREHGSAQFEQYRDTAAEQIETLAKSAKSAAEQLQDSDTFGLSHYVTDVAQSMTTLAENLRGKSADELLQQAGKLARDNPALFLSGSIALGFGLSRFLRASNTGATSTLASSTPSDRMGERYKTEISQAVAADEEVPMTPPHTDDVLHSARPGVPDRTSSAQAGTSTAGSSPATGPHGGIATYPDTGPAGSTSQGSSSNPGQSELSSDGASRTGLPKDGLSRGDV